LSTPESTQAVCLDPVAPGADWTARTVYPAAELRRRAAELARSLAGLGANPRDPELRARYVDLVAPGETPRMRTDMAAMSGCALVAAGFWRAMGVKHRALLPPYHIGFAVERLWDIGKATSAGRWPNAEQLDDRTRALGALPAPGDIVFVGEEPAREHVFVCIESGLRAGSCVVYGLDGGQRDDEGHQLIGLREHAWFTGARGRVFDVARDITPGKSWGAARRVMGWADLETVVAATSGGKENA
jgi:hypothetical protein